MLSLEKAKEILEDCKWTHPEHYGGYSPDGDYCIYSRNRDSSILENVNYESIYKLINGLNPDNWPEDWAGDEPPGHDFRASHWAVGWVEYIIVKANAPDSMIICAAEIVAALSDYPIFDEMKYSDACYNAIIEYWQTESLQSRIEYCKESGESIFAARNDGPPESVYGTLSESIY